VGAETPAQSNNPQPAEIREQLERILKSPAFRNSQRYSAFLKYCVEQSLQGQSDSPKERNIGIEVFGRPADYDTAADHVVRSAASEIRKRLAQYYQQAPSPHELRINLFSGSYVPQFSAPPVAFQTATTPAPARPPRFWPLAALVILTGAFVVLLLRWNNTGTPSALDLFWKPILSSNGRATLCVGAPMKTTDEPEITNATTVLQLHQLASNRINFASAAALARIAGLLQSKGKPYKPMLQSATKFGDLQEGPAVLIGGFSNDWTLRLTAGLRFGFDGWPTAAIRDRQHPDQKNWSVDFSLPYKNLTRDYALISRVHDQKTEQTTLVVAGIAYWGTLAAAEFVTDPQQMLKLQSRAPAHWENMNIQVVIATDVIDAVAGAPKVLAAYFW
jgi:hypothetical protein